MKKVLVTGPINKKLLGGQITHINSLVTAFYESNDFEISLFASSKGKYNAESKVLKIIRFVFDFWVFIYKCIKSDVVHINSTLDSRSVVRDGIFAITSIAMRKKTIIQYHGGNIENVVILNNRILMKFFQYVLNKASKVLVLTNNQYNSLSAMASNNIEVVRNFVNVELNGAVCTRELKHECNFNIVFLGRLERAKGIYELIEACKILREKQHTFSLTLVGDGPDIKMLKKLVSSYLLNEQVNFEGFLTGEGKQNILLNSSVMVLPSYSEGLPYSVLEGLAYGLPIICTKVGALPDILTENIEALFIKTQDSESLVAALLKLIENQKLRESMASNALIKSKDFDFNKLRIVFSEIWGR